MCRRRRWVVGLIAFLLLTGIPLLAINVQNGRAAQKKARQDAYIALRKGEFREEEARVTFGEPISVSTEIVSMRTLKPSGGVSNEADRQVTRTVMYFWWDDEKAFELVFVDGILTGQAGPSYTSVPHKTFIEWLRDRFR